jgi:hypothetical protein
VATTKKEPHVNRFFSKEIQEKGKELIEAGQEFSGGFWQNRTRTSYTLGYGDWKSVPEEIQLYLNQVNRAASMRGKAEKKAEKEKRKHMETTQGPIPTADIFVISDNTLQEIHNGVQKIPKTATPQQIRTIREYISRQSGFDPNRLLLGVASHLEK